MEAILMKRYAVISISALAALAAAAPVEAAKKAGGGKCVMAGGQATMVTQDLAKFMAEAALKNAIAAHNWTASGAVKVTCDTEAGMPHCTAKRKACG
jgi:hypothetical protein